MAFGGSEFHISGACYQGGLILWSRMNYKMHDQQSSKRMTSELMLDILFFRIRPAW
jgi:hypothetical protein